MKEIGDEGFMFRTEKEERVSQIVISVFKFYNQY